MFLGTSLYLQKLGYVVCYPKCVHHFLSLQKLSLWEVHASVYLRIRVFHLLPWYIHNLCVCVQK